MGVPAFFRWLSRKYASIVVHCVEEKIGVFHIKYCFYDNKSLAFLQIKKEYDSPKAREVDGVKFPVDSSQPNPNDYEFDNLYLDMNGIIHPCCHPENKPAPKNEDEMMVAIFEYIDRIFSIVRPRKLLYMAIDGVAPRAKMNQQRSRRFRASKETKDKAEEISKIRSDLTAKGARLPPEKEKTEHFDSNCITPGTEFMANLSVCLRYYIADRLNDDPGWKNIKVVLSDANVPGEGEHKIMDYIRKQRASPGHDPNTRHCLNGADADLIMLGLATHEPHFTIIREEFKPNQKRPCEICGQVGHMMDECMGLPKEKQGEHDELPAPVAQEVEFIFIRLNVLREYLERELEMQSLPFPYNFERCIDDWVFMCFFVGNDFLPHLPSLEIREGAIDRLVRFYKNVVPRCGGYITDNGFVDLNKVQLVLQELGYVEDEIFKKRQQDNIAYKKRLKANKERDRQQRMRDSPMWVPGGQFSPHLLGSGTPGAITSPRQQAYDMRRQGMAATSGQSKDNQTAAADLRSMLLKTPEGSSQSPNSSLTQLTPDSAGVKRKADDDDDPPDNIRLWEDGWKGRYYTNKFGVTESDAGFNDFRKKVADAYVEGLCWVLRYYYQGCPSWKWYYPYHYAPFASDFRELGELKNEFEMGTKPFKPLEQLMSVFPAASGKFLPPTWRDLMSNPESPIIDFYPVDFDIDLNGKKYAWQGVALLPFVDEKRMLGTLAKVYPDITDEEKKRNSLGMDRLFAREGHPVFDFFKGLYEGGQEMELIEMVTDLTQGMSGKVQPEIDSKAIVPNTTIPSPVANLRDLRDNRSIGVLYEDPYFSEGYVFKTTLLPNVEMPPRVLKPGDYNSKKPWRPVIGMNTQRRSYATIAPAGHRMTNFHTRDGQQGTPPSRFSGGGRGGGGIMGTPPSRYPQGGGGGYGGGYGASHDPRRSSYGGHDQSHHRANYGSSNYGNSSYGRGNYGNSNYGGGNYGGSYGNRNQYQQGYSRDGYQGNRPRDPRQERRQDSQDEQRRHSYPLSGYRYKPY